MPEWLHHLIQLNPLEHYIEFVYGILLSGAGLDALWDSILAMLLLGPTARGADRRPALKRKRATLGSDPPRNSGVRRVDATLRSEALVTSPLLAVPGLHCLCLSDRTREPHNRLEELWLFPPMSRASCPSRRTAPGPTGLDNRSGGVLVPACPWHRLYT
jgi:hypothetical protein